MRSLFALSAAALVACSSSSSDPQAAPDAGADAAESGVPSTLQLQMKVTVPAAKEVFRCQLIKLPASTDPELFVQSTKHEYTPGSHHYLVFRTRLKDVPTGLDRPFDCAEGDGVMNKYATDFVFGGQVPKEERALPEGVALPLASGSVVALQAHYINPTPKELEATVTVELRIVDKSKVQHRAGIYRMYDPYIYVPPKSTATAQMRCPVKKDIKVIGLAPHMHARGVTQTAWIDPPTGKSTTPVLVNDDWEHPKEARTAFDVKAGSFFRFQCAYKHDGEAPVYQGQSANDEMCMLTAFYYPAMAPEDEFCFTEADMLGNGTRTCAQTTDCIRGCPPGEAPRPAPGLTGVDVGKCFQQCIVESCPNATGPMFKQFQCIQSKCSSECASGGDGCTACAIEKCADQVLACQNLACDK